MNSEVTQNAVVPSIAYFIKYFGQELSTIALLVAFNQIAAGKE